MSNKENRNLNITINNSEDENRVILSFGTLGKKLKKYFLIWVITAVVLLAVAVGFSAITTHVNKVPLTALISFSYSGVEKGLDPDGMKFDVNSIKNPEVIESALTELGYGLEQLEIIRRNITFNGQRPKDIIERLTTYEQVLDESGSIAAAEKILETSYYPTQYTVSFDYNETEFSDEEAVAVFNEILNNYTDYFYEKYGYNENLGNAVTAISYTDYDYAEALDVFENSISTLRRYVGALAGSDQTRFRSTVTGYTFDDLYSALGTVRSIDLDMISSYISIHNLTKDKESSLAYYELRIKSLNREKTELEEELEAYKDAIEAYKKDQVIVFNGADGTNTESTYSSDQYDKMFTQMNGTATSLASIKQQINYYKERQQSLKNGTVGTKAQHEKVEADLAALNEKVNNLVNLVYDTSEDYYRNVTFRNAYNILAPAANTASDKAIRIVKNTILPAIILEVLAIVVYLAVAIGQALISDNRKAKMLALAEGIDNDDDDDDDDDDNDDDDKDVKEEIKAEKKNKK